VTTESPGRAGRKTPVWWLDLSWQTPEIEPQDSHRRNLVRTRFRARFSADIIETCRTPLRLTVCDDTRAFSLLIRGYGHRTKTELHALEKHCVTGHLTCRSEGAAKRRTESAIGNPTRRGWPMGPVM